MADIFISYRRSDSSDVAGRLYDRLSEDFGGEHVFMDIEDISAGQNFVKQLSDKLDLCNIMLILIGPDWLSEQNEEGLRRLDDPEDFVIGTGVTHSVEELVEIAFGRADLDWREYVKQDPRFIRPAEVDLLLADPSKAKAKLDWEPKVTFREMIETMVDADLARLSRTA